MYIKFLSTIALSVAILFMLLQNVACNKDISDKAGNSKARLNRRKVMKRQDYYPVSNVQGYQTYSPATVYPAGSVYTQPLQPAPAPAPAPAAAPAPANPLELGGLLSNLKLPALPTIASPAASGGNPYAGYPYYYGAAPKKDDDDDEDEEDDDKNNEDDDDEE